MQHALSVTAWVADFSLNKIENEQDTAFAGFCKIIFTFKL